MALMNKKMLPGRIPMVIGLIFLTIRNKSDTFRLRSRPPTSWVLITAILQARIWSPTQMAVRWRRSTFLRMTPWNHRTTFSPILGTYSDHTAVKRWNWLIVKWSGRGLAIYYFRCHAPHKKIEGKLVVKIRYIIGIEGGLWGNVLKH